MIEIENQPETAVRVIDLNELYPNAERMPVSSKLRTYLKQVSLKIASDKILENNSYLARLVTESSLFLPEMFLERWVKHWEYQIAIPQESIWVSSSIDFAINRENEILILDWSGMESDCLAIAQAYLLSQRLSLKPRNISVVSLIANPLNEDRRINFVRRLFGENDFMICQQELSERLVLLVRGEDLDPVPEPEPILDPFLDIKSIPEIAID